MKYLAKIIFISTVLIAVWQLVVIGFSLPRYIVAPPWDVAQALIKQWPLLYKNAKVTFIEIVLGLVFGFSFGLASALLLMLSRRVSAVMMPLFVLSQAVPVFAIAPLLVLWFGYGMGSKVMMAVLIIYFPVTAACYDGLRNTPTQWLDLAHSLRASRWVMLTRIRLPAALPSLASGLRIAVTFAPIGAVVGEWVGSAEGLGYLMLQANARMQSALVFSALLLLVAMSLTLYFTTDALLKKWVPWQKHL